MGAAFCQHVKRRHEVILDDLKLDRDWWAYTKLFGGLAVMAALIFSFFAFVL